MEMTSPRRNVARRLASPLASHLCLFVEFHESLRSAKRKNTSLRKMSSPKNVVDCSKVRVSADAHGGMGAFATCSIKKGDIVEIGLVRVVDLDGMKNPYVFTWSEDRTVWAFGSGCSTFYNSSLNPNTEMERNYEKLTFVITAIQDIKEGEELTHTYKSLRWRTAFHSLSETLEKEVEK